MCLHEYLHSNIMSEYALKEWYGKLDIHIWHRRPCKNREMDVQLTFAEQLTQGQKSTVTFNNFAVQELLKQRFTGIF